MRAAVRITVVAEPGMAVAAAIIDLEAGRHKSPGSSAAVRLIGLVNWPVRRLSGLDGAVPSRFARHPDRKRETSRPGSL